MEKKKDEYLERLAYAAHSVYTHALWSKIVAILGVANIGIACLMPLGASRSLGLYVGLACLGVAVVIYSIFCIFSENVRIVDQDLREYLAACCIHGRDELAASLRTLFTDWPSYKRPVLEFMKGMSVEIPDL